MKVGCFTPLLSALPLEQVLAKLKALGMDTVEFGTGNYPGDAHAHLSMLDDAGKLADFKSKIADAGMTISALSSHGNALHPDRAIATKHAETSKKTILLAEKLGVDTVVDFSGCPGDSPNAKFPNWVTCPWPPDFLEVLEWQWNEVVTPYWKQHGKFAADHGVKIAIEMHPGFVVYNPETMLRLRAIAGKSVGANLDPSHLFWQGIEPIDAVRGWATPSIMSMPRTPRCSPSTCPGPACWTPSPIPTNATAAGCSAPWAMATARNGGASSSPPCACMAMTMCCPSSMKTGLMSPDEGLSKAAALLNQLVIKEKTRRGLVGVMGRIRTAVIRHRLHGPGAPGSAAPGGECGRGGNRRTSADKARAAAEGFNVLNSTGDWQDVIRDPSIDAVHIATPNAEHFPMAKAAFEPASMCCAKSRWP